MNKSIIYCLCGQGQSLLRLVLKSGAGGFGLDEREEDQGLAVPKAKYFSTEISAPVVSVIKNIKVITCEHECSPPQAPPPSPVCDRCL